MRHRRYPAAVPDSSPLRARLGAVIRRHREAAGLSQDALADRASLHRTFIGTVERSESNLSLDTLERLARALEVSVGDLVQEAERDDGVPGAVRPPLA